MQVKKQQLKLDNCTWNNRVVPTGKRVCQGCVLSPCFLNLYVEYVMKNTGLEEAQAGIKIARKNDISITSDMQMTPPLRHKVKKN